MTWSHIGLLMSNRRTAVHLCGRFTNVVSQDRRTFVFLSVSLWNDLADPRLRWCGTGVFQEQGEFFFIGLSSCIPTIVFYYFSISLLPVYRLVLWGWGLRTDDTSHSVSALNSRPLLIIIIIIIIIIKLHALNSCSTSYTSFFHKT